MKLFLLLLLSQITYPLRAENATPQVSVELIRTLKPDSITKVRLVCPRKGACDLAKLDGDLTVATGNITRREATQWVREFLQDLPKEDVTIGTAERRMNHTREVEITFYATDGARTGSGQLMTAELQKPGNPKLASYAKAIGKLEMRLLRSVK